MKKQNYFYVSGVVFTVITFLHLVRALSGWSVWLGDMQIPMWVSWVVVVIGAYLAVSGFNLSHNKK